MAPRPVHKIRCKMSSKTTSGKISRIREGIDLEDFVSRLTSRKFWLTVLVCLYFMWRGIVGPPTPAFGSLTQVIIAFLAIQGGTDALARFAEVRMTGRPSTQSYRESSDLDPEVMAATSASLQSDPPITD